MVNQFYLLSSFYVKNLLFQNCGRTRVGRWLVPSQYFRLCNLFTLPTLYPNPDRPPKSQGKVFLRYL
ncbi:hypothetical protein SAMN05216332_11135 [Nitrosospira briensis]|nr:hypothetical protein SAMN05216332_11135 [Nitrosospira briensis]